MLLIMIYSENEKEICLCPVWDRPSDTWSKSGIWKGMINGSDCNIYSMVAEWRFRHRRRRLVFITVIFQSIWDSDNSVCRSVSTYTVCQHYQPELYHHHDRPTPTSAHKICGRHHLVAFIDLCSLVHYLKRHIKMANLEMKPMNYDEKGQSDSGKPLPPTISLCDIQTDILPVNIHYTKKVKDNKYP